VTSPVCRVGIVLGSDSDLETMLETVKVLDTLGIGHEVVVASAHRTPRRTEEWASGAAARGLRVLIAAAGGAAALPGVVAASSSLPVIGVPIASSSLNGLDALLSIVQMPKGVPVATFAIGEAGAANAALFAVALLAGAAGVGADAQARAFASGLADQLAAFRVRQNQAAQAMTLPAI
jgi:5-(carboxyamino)imidazole ribonucleotide mutase